MHTAYSTASQDLLLKLGVGGGGGGTGGRGRVGGRCLVAAAYVDLWHHREMSTQKTSLKQKNS